MKTRMRKADSATVKPPYSGHPLQQTTIYNGEFPQEQMR